jgi:hypothetical protein
MGLVGQSKTTERGETTAAMGRLQALPECPRMGGKQTLVIRALSAAGLGDPFSRQVVDWIEWSATRLIRLLYVSRSTLVEKQADLEVAAIVARSVTRNLKKGITGALMFTGTHFAQALEGEDDEVDALMHDIYNDKRHDMVRVVDRQPIDARRFPRWGMAYNGRASYVDNPMASLLAVSAGYEPAHEGPQSYGSSLSEQARIYWLMSEFTAE